MDKIFIIILLLIAANSCINERSKLKDELESSNKNVKDYSDLVNKSDEEISKFSDKELVDFAVKLYTNVGGLAHYKEDSVKLLKALHFLELAISKNPNNESAYQNKINLHISFKDYRKAISTINSLFDIQGEYPEGLMYKGVLYEILGIRDSSYLAYQKALNSYNRRIEESNNINDKVSKAILYCLLKGEVTGLKEINKVILENPNNEFAKQIKSNIIENFDRGKFIKESI